MMRINSHLLSYCDHYSLLSNFNYHYQTLITSVFLFILLSPSSVHSSSVIASAVAPLLPLPLPLPSPPSSSSADQSDPLSSSSSSYQASSSSWNYAYHYNWPPNNEIGGIGENNDQLGPKVSRYAETSTSKQYVDPTISLPIDGPASSPSTGINRRSYRHIEPKNHHGDSRLNPIHGTGDSSAFIENIRKEIMSSFKETLPQPGSGGHFALHRHHHHHHPSSPDFHHLASHPRENVFDSAIDMLPRNFDLPPPFLSPPVPPPPPPPPSSVSSHGSGSTPSAFVTNNQGGGVNLSRKQRSHRSHHHHHQPEPDTSKSHSWNFNTNQGFYYRVRDIDGKKHEERGSYGDNGQNGSPSWVDNHLQGRSLVQEINPVNGFNHRQPNHGFLENFVFPPNQRHPYPSDHHHHNQHQHPPIWFQPGFNNNNNHFNQQFQGHKPNHNHNNINNNNNGGPIDNRNHFAPANNNHHHPPPPPQLQHKSHHNRQPNNFQ